MDSARHREKSSSWHPRCVTHETCWADTMNILIARTAAKEHEVALEKPLTEEVDADNSDAMQII